MTHETFRRAALAGLALLAAAGAPALAQQGTAPARPGGAPARQKDLAPDADWHRTVASALGPEGRAGRRPDPAGLRARLLAVLPHGQELMVMGDLVLLETEVAPVMRRLAAGGIEVTALHNHLLRAQPATMYLLVGGDGEAARLAAALRAALQETATPLQGAAAPAGDDGRVEGVDTAAFAQTLGRQGRAGGGVYGVPVPRAEPVSDGGMEVPTAMGSATAINLQAAGNGKGAVTGDFVLTAGEVVPVQRALVEHGIEVTAIHNHMLDDRPRLFFMHFWGMDDPETLGRGLRAALERTNSRRAG